LLEHVVIAVDQVDQPVFLADPPRSPRGWPPPQSAFERRRGIARNGLLSELAAAALLAGEPRARYCEMVCHER